MLKGQKLHDFSELPVPVLNWTFFPPSWWPEQFPDNEGKVQKGKLSLEVRHGLPLVNPHWQFRLPLSFTCMELISKGIDLVCHGPRWWSETDQPVVPQILFSWMNI